jgi:hypothetical protein
MSKIQTVPPEVPNTDIVQVIKACTMILKTTLAVPHTRTKDEEQELANLKAEIDRPRGPAAPSVAMPREDVREWAKNNPQNPGTELELPPGGFDPNL